MSIPTPTRLKIQRQADLPRARQLVRQLASELGFSLVSQTKLVTAVSELARNMIVHAGGGILRLYTRKANGRTGLFVEFDDRGPGIPDVELALKDGYSTGKGLGLGFGGARRLVNDFMVTTKPGQGTLVRIAQWKS